MQNTKHCIIIGDSRKMNFIQNESVELVVCSPPYWNIKDYDNSEQIGFGQSYNDYIKDLNSVWAECWRGLKFGCYLCIAIGDQYLSAKEFGRYRTKSIEGDIINYCESIGFDLIAKIIWQKISTTKTSGGCNIMGSLYFPREVRPTMEHEYIIILKKITPNEYKKREVRKPSIEIKNLSEIPKDQFHKYIRGIWNVKGDSIKGHPAPFPIEIPYRLIQMYSFVGETVLDCFLGSGSTMMACKRLNRNSIGIELNEGYLPIIKKRIQYGQKSLIDNYKYEIRYDR